MRLLSIRNEFSCCVLEPGCEDDLQVLFDAKMLLYTDDNPDVDNSRDEVLRDFNEYGPDLYKDALGDPGDRFYVLLDEQGELIGSAFAYQTSAPDVMFFGSSHIHSKYRGRGLIDLFYEAREDYARSVEGCKKIKLNTRPENYASQKAAHRNEFSCINPEETDLLVFEKRL